MENLQIDDLLPECEKCEGSGEMENPSIKNNSSYGVKIVSPTQVDCDECNGK